jgi:vitamin K-dependent gamma-carboxylase
MRGRFLRDTGSAATRLLAVRVDAASVAVFRMALGAIIAWESYRFIANDWIARYWIEPRFHFHYYGFEWVQPWTPQWMYIHMYVIGIAAVAVALGLWYRPSAIILWATFTYQFLLEQARYLNHFYAASLLTFLMIFVPANRVWSLDAAIARRRTSAATGEVPAWTLLILRFQVGVIYFFGGIAKINSDWLAGASVTEWMSRRTALPVVSWIVRHRLEVFVFAYGGLLFDLLVVPALLWRRTRPFAFVAALLFHFANANLFRIGIFPWMMAAATTLFFAPSWPRQLWAALAESPAADAAPSTTSVRAPLRGSVIAALSAYVLLQLALPLRHFAYPGDVAWTYEGHRFSWRMMLHAKRAKARFLVATSSGSRQVEPTDYLMPWQTEAMTRPDMVLQFAHFLAKTARADSGHEVRVYASVTMTRNGRASVPMIDSTVDLASVPRTLRHATWILSEPATVQRR